MTGVRSKILFSDCLNSALPYSASPYYYNEVQVYVLWLAQLIFNIMILNNLIRKKREKVDKLHYNREQ